MRATGIAAALAVTCICSGAFAGAASAASPADIQWAQETLKAKGYDIGGRATPKMTDGAKRAISKFQAANGLPVTGEPDQATLNKLLADREGDKKHNATVGTLGGANGAPKPSHAVRESAPQPKAAPTTRVDNAGGSETTLTGVSLGRGPNPALIPQNEGGRGSTGTYSANATAPRAATRPGDISALEDAPSPTAAPAASMSVSGDTLGGQDTGFGFKASNWMRYTVGGVLALTLGVLGFGWWRSGRRQLAEPGYGYNDYDSDEHQPPRRDPVFGKSGRSELSAGLPPLAAPSRGRR